MNGDINKDGKVDLNDVTALTDKLLENRTTPEDDIDGDGKVNMWDVTALVDKVLSGDTEEEPVDEGLITVNGVEFRMILVEHGAFTMGAPLTEASSLTNEKPQHKVTLTKDYWIGETPVTQELWQAVMGKNPSIHKDPQCPVEYVSWNDCQAFIEKLNQLTGSEFRLPTEAEWEFAARGGNLGKGYKFAGSDAPKEVAWYISNSGGSSCPVKGLKPNELGIYDMSGNVHEWTNDWYKAYTKDDVVDPSPESGSFKVYRGGSWNDGASLCRCAFRYMREVSFRTNWLGLRLVLSK